MGSAEEALRTDESRKSGAQSATDKQAAPWLTPEQIERIREKESHSSNDSVIKSLLKDRELAKFAGEGIDTGESSAHVDQQTPPDKPFDDLTVLGELISADSGVLFLWCPNCETEVAHLTVENPLDISVFEIECQHCLSGLDRYAIVAIEIGYPIERKLADDALQDDLKECVIDYWDRTLETFSEDATDESIDAEQLIWQFDEYITNFGWEWPSDVPVVALEPGRTYRNTATGERVEVLESVTENRNSLDILRVKRYPDTADPEGVEPEIMDSNEIVDLVTSRCLLIED
jgi:hypothetical protein